MLAWFCAGVFLVVMVLLLVRAMCKQAVSKDELSTSAWAFAVPVPGGVVLTLAAFGVSPFLLAVPGAVYLCLLLVTRGRPLLMLGRVIERFDANTSDWYALACVALLLVVFGVLRPV